ncbi:hypothetical protein MMC31_007484 [Peltigera leucophlebia]|nr:hypothetical protein [Peltigera leucophlebia]
MAELALAVIAVPGSAVGLFKLADVVVERIKCFQHASSSLDKLKDFGYDLCNGNLYLAVQLVENFITDDRPGNEEIKSLAEKHLEKLRAGLTEAQEILEKSVDGEGQVNRWYYTVEGERKLERILKDLQKWQSVFMVFISLAERSRQISPRNMLLTPQRFCLTSHHQDGFMGLHLDSAPHVRLASAEYKDEKDKIRETDVLIEPQNIQKVQDTTALLAGHLGKKWTTAGVLQCLGYLIDPRVELVFLIPSNLRNPKSLKSLIASNNDGNEPGSKPSINSRIFLATALSEAVLSVHSASLVHKSIQPETILVFEKWDKDETQCNGETSLGVPILTGWSMSRKIDELSSRVGEDDWMKNIYRHPQRQGLQLEKRYHMGHDLYSLGVCLLELGLWEPLIARENNQPETMSGRYCDMALRMKCIDPGEVGVLKRLVKPAVVQEVVRGMAEHDLGQEMGRGYSQVVLACFQYVEALGATDKLEGSNSDLPMMYHKWILQPLSDLLLQAENPPINA